ncbi:MAG: translation initiation factor IF-2 [Gammaproteobacteria bacterium]|jgi:translation initiation factor IF-2|nr:translation initiation factor IF-2 [Gammaproteobacteria bacterium]MDP6615689.1 translation initiation factor IF-2 [Gammaproteobacteria bacterium]MDP6695300.1 translation initiation factor IF-2 [Gammaproteobacteria bacterium]
MSGVTVAEFAETLNVSVERLLVQLEEAGVSVSGADDIISDDAKMELLNHLRRAHGRKEDKLSVAPSKITLNRRDKTELRMSGGQGRSRTVNVEVRRKKSYIKRDVLEEEARRQQEELEAERAAEEAAQAEAERLEKEREAAAQAEEEKAAEDEARRAEEARNQAEETAKVAEEEQLRVQAEKAAREAAEAESAKRNEDSRVQRRTKAQDAGHTLHVASDKKRRRKKKQTRRRSVSVNVDSQHAFEQPTEPVVREVQIPESIPVGELAQQMAIKGGEVIKVMMDMGVMATINQVIDQDTAILVVEELGHTPVAVQDDALDEQILGSIAVEGEEQPRAPVVTIMGHVDHGKTSLLDYIRRTKVAAGEAGGITQHIGAYSVKTDKGQVTFLDTPGHAAFTAMRARGAQVTDIVVLVIAADDGVKPQTQEAVQHAKAAEVPLVVAVNKIDKPAADLDRVRNELAALEVIPEDWAGDNIFVNVSAQTGEGIDDLLDAILLQADVLELKAVEDGPAAGIVIESSLETGRGTVATALITRGTLNVGDSIVAGEVFGRVRKMLDESGKEIMTAGPSTPAAILGLSGTPSAGDELVAVGDERKAREVAQFRHGRTRDAKLAQQQSSKLEDVFTQMQNGGLKTLQILVKADVHGSAEALRDALMNLSNEEVAVNVISAGVGGITESDVNLAAASNAIVIGFNVRADGAARNAVKESGVEVRYYSIIYEAIEDVESAVGGMLSPEIREQIVGLAEVRDVFKSPKLGDIAGCLVMEGFVKRSNPIRVLREDTVIYEGELESLRRFKDDVNEVKSGTECGIGVKNYNDVKVGDQIECYERIEVARSLK